MDLRALEERNGMAVEAVERFREEMDPARYGAIDDRFHRFKNHNHYFGFIEAEAEDVRVAMFSGNDDLVAMTYFWYGPSSYEPLSLKLWLEEAAGAKTIFDVGAFTGLYSLMAATANPGAAVHAFEPVRRTYGRLLLNVQANGLTQRIRTVNMAVSDAPGEAVIKQFRAENILGNGASILDKDIPITASDETVRLTTLDRYASETGCAPDLVKIDVEGAELLALGGMKETLSRGATTIIIEVTPKTAKPVIAVLSGFGYCVQVIDDQSGRLAPAGEEPSRGGNLYAKPSTTVHRSRSVSAISP